MGNRKRHGLKIKHTKLQHINEEVFKPENLFCQYSYFNFGEGNILRFFLECWRVSQFFLYYLKFFSTFNFIQFFISLVSQMMNSTISIIKIMIRLLLLEVLINKNLFFFFIFQRSSYVIRKQYFQTLKII